MGMIKRIWRKFLNKFLGDNAFLLQAISKCYSKSPVKGRLLAMYVAPVSNSLRFDNLLIEYDIISSIGYYEKLHELLHIADLKNFQLVRIGKEYDGGYIMPDDFADDDKIAYSFGIDGDVSWDRDMAARGYDIFMYDHTIDGLPEENQHFHWRKLGIADGETQDDRLKTLDELIKQNHHEYKRNMILKMDVEKAEYGFIEMVSSEMLSQFTQILIEFHGLNEPALQDKVIAALNKLNMTHAPVHIHGQNIGYYISFGEHIFCNQVEVTYVRRDKYDIDADYEVILPLDIDMPARKHIPEVCLGRWNNEMHHSGNFKLTAVIL